MLAPKAYIIEYEKDGHFRQWLSLPVPGQTLKIARLEKETDNVTVMDEAEVIFAD